jgi:aryl-alcohol dehydrogenase-like predicted oxidoreductase
MAQHNEDGQEKLTFATIDRIRSIAEDLGQPMADVALAWLLHQRGVRSVIFGARSPAQVAANMRAASLKLDDSILGALNQATDGLKQALGPNADLWAAKSRII